MLESLIISDGSGAFELDAEVFELIMDAFGFWIASMMATMTMISQTRWY